jgi:protein-tyrosine-phosphatase
MLNGRKKVSGAVWRASHAAWPAAAEAFRGMAGRAITAVRGPSSSKGVRRIIFACIRNAGRSQMAVAFFNQLADPQRARAISVGTAPSGSVDPKVIEAMREIGVDLSPSIPRRLNAPLAMAAGYLVNVGCGEDLPFLRASSSRNGRSTIRRVNPLRECARSVTRSGAVWQR